MPPIDTALAAVLRRLRIERGLSQEAVAHQAGVSYTTLAKIELAQSNPGWATVRAVADALGVKLAELAAAVEAQSRQQGLDDQAQKARRR